MLFFLLRFSLLFSPFFLSFPRILGGSPNRKTLFFRGFNGFFKRGLEGQGKTAF